MSDKPERVPFKAWFNASLVDTIAGDLVRVAPHFDANLFKRVAARGLDALEMTPRVRQIATAMHAAFSAPIEDALRAIVASLPPVLPSAEDVTSGGFRFWPYSEFIARFGVDAPAASFDAMIALTQRFTSEFAIRPFLAADLDGTLARLADLVDHPSLHVRRWVSEGTRTRLPWGTGVPGLRDALPQRIALLSRLRDDPELYVRRSVANHVGDILKDDVDAGLDLLRAWHKDATPEVAWVIKHAARATLKAGHPGALALFGQDAVPVSEVRFSVSPASVGVGDSVELKLSFRVESRKSRSVRVDYALVAPGKGSRNTRKVFRWADREASNAAPVTLDTRYAFVPRTIRAVHPGPHTFEVVANGQIIATHTIEVT